MLKNLPFIIKTKTLINVLYYSAIMMKKIFPLSNFNIKSGDKSPDYNIKF